MTKWLRLILIPVLLLVFTQSSGVINANPAGHFGTVDSAGHWQHTTIQKAVKTALLFPSNGVSGSDIRIVWDGSVYLPRNTHTAIWKAKLNQQNSYYSIAWHSVNTGAWTPSFAFGTHPYPTLGEYAAAGTTGTGNNQGSVHYYEIANGTDLISTSSYDLPVEGQTVQDKLIVTKGIWVTQARTSWVVGSDVYHLYYPDLENNPNFQIFYKRAISTIYQSSPTNPAFYFGASDWSGNGNTNSETCSCYLRFMKLFDARLSYADIVTEASAETNTPQTSAGSASVFYMNINPTVDDVTDKSGQGHDPSWANSNRPSDWQEAA